MRLPDVASLVVEVLDADPAQRAHRQPEAEDEVRALVVDVDLERTGVAGHQHRFADRLEVIADGVDVEGAQVVGLEQEHRLVAEALVGVGDERRYPGSLAGPRSSLDGACRRSLREMEQGALEEPVEALSAGIDHAGLAQDGQQARRAGHGVLGRLDGRTEDGFDVRVALGRGHGRRGRLADHGQDRALDRLGDRAVGRPRALRQGVRQVQPVEPRLSAERLGHAPEDLAGDDARVAAGAHQRPEADRRSDTVGRLARHPIGLLERRSNRGQHVRSGVAVGDRVDVEGVDLVDVRFEVRDRGSEGLQQARTIAGPSGHQATSVPLSARSRGPIAPGAAATTAGGTTPGLKRSPPT